jgi:hypothetical protein
MGTQSRLAAIVALLALITASGLPAVAQSPSFGGDRVKNDPDGQVQVETGVRIATPASAEGPSGRSRPSTHVWVGVPAFGSSGDLNDDNQGVCTRTEWSRVLREEAAEVESQAWARYQSLYAGLGLNNEGIRSTVSCPQEPNDVVPVALVEEFVTAAVSEQLPRPTLSLPPGYAITGLRTYLVTEHELTFGPATTQIDLGIVTLGVTISGTGSSSVDWGDGTVTSHDTGGTGYPDGAINHVYTDAGTVDITVTDRWTVSYEAGPFVGTIEAPLAPVTLPGVEIQERQSVRTD